MLYEEWDKIKTEISIKIAVCETVDKMIDLR